MLLEWWGGAWKASSCPLSASWESSQTVMEGSGDTREWIGAVLAYRCEHLTHLETFPDFSRSLTLMRYREALLLASVQPLLHSFLHVLYPSQVCCLGDKSGIGIRTILAGPILFSQELKRQDRWRRPPSILQLGTFKLQGVLSKFTQ